MSALTRRQWLAGAAAAVWPLRLRAAGRRPNIVLVMADDQGWGDTGYNGHPTLQTPYLDSMARSGFRFDRFYAGSPVCSPTRGSCLTGRHPFRYGIHFANAGRPGEPSQYSLPSREVTLAHVLKDAGYETGHFGKWHLGDFDGPKRSSPADAGFDDWFSTVRKVPTLDPPPEEYWDNGKPVSTKLTGDDSRLIVDRALRFMQRAAKRKRPFLSVIWMHTPHLPVLAASKFRRRYSMYSEAEQHYWGALTAMDLQIGRLRNELRRLGPKDGTMLWFTSDNGPEGDQRNADWPGSAGLLRGRKASLFEGGIRVPGLLEWPQLRQSPSLIGATASTSDYFPTILDALGLDPPDRRPLDGVSLMPVLLGKAKARSVPLAFETTRVTRGSPRLCLIDGPLKLLTNLDDSPDVLHDLDTDSAETINLADSRPDECRRLRAILKTWRESCRASAAGADYPAGA